MTKHALPRLLLLLLLPSCAMVRAHVDHPLNEDRIQQLQRGVTTKQQVLEWFGPPQVIDAREIVAVSDVLGLPGDDDTRVERVVAARYFRYEHTRGNGGILLLGVFNYFDLDVKRDALVIFFDGKDLVQDFAFARDTDQLGSFGPLTR